MCRLIAFSFASLSLTENSVFLTEFLKFVYLFSHGFGPLFFTLFVQEWDLDKFLHYVSLLLEPLATLLPLGGETAEMSQALLYI